MQNRYSIYQPKDEALSIPLDSLWEQGRTLEQERRNYRLVYTGVLGPKNGPEHELLEEIYSSLVPTPPPDYTGRPLSVGDVVALWAADMIGSHYLDSSGFVDMPEFMLTRHIYYATQRPIDIGTFPKTGYGPVRVEPFDQRRPVEGEPFEAWGLLEYNQFLQGNLAKEYELRGAYDNVGTFSLPPCQIEARVQIVGRWEQAQHTPPHQRLTEWEDGPGRFRIKSAATLWQLERRFQQAIQDMENDVRG